MIIDLPLSREHAHALPTNVALAFDAPDALAAAVFLDWGLARGAATVIQGIQFHPNLNIKESVRCCMHYSDPNVRKTS